MFKFNSKDLRSLPAQEADPGRSKEFILQIFLGIFGIISTFLALAGIHYRDSLACFLFRRYYPLDSQDTVEGMHDLRMSNGYDLKYFCLLSISTEHELERRNTVAGHEIEINVERGLATSACPSFASSSPVAPHCQPYTSWLLLR